MMPDEYTTILLGLGEQVQRLTARVEELGQQNQELEARNQELEAENKRLKNCCMSKEQGREQKCLRSRRTIALSSIKGKARGHQSTGRRTQDEKLSFVSQDLVFIHQVCPKQAASNSDNNMLGG
jgi:regulator of replication initiation timing